MIYAVILAAGNGVRMNNVIPKQFLEINLKPIFIYSVLEFSLNKKIDKIIVCVPKKWIEHTKTEIKKYINNDNIIVIEGSNTRNDTLITSCNFIKDNYGITKNDIIITHDAVRPFINQRIINDNIKEIKKYDAVTTAIPSTDTIIKSDSKKVLEIPNRMEMFMEQTPQTFNLSKLINNYKKLSKEEINNLTDATNIFVLAKETASIVKGEVSNIKITTEQDLLLAEVISQIFLIS